MKNTISNTMNSGRNAIRNAYMARRQADNYERFMQGKADVFQVTGTKEQAMFWSQGLLAR